MCLFRGASRQCRGKLGRIIQGICTRHTRLMRRAIYAVLNFMEGVGTSHRDSSFVAVMQFMGAQRLLKRTLSIQQIEGAEAQESKRESGGERETKREEEREQLRVELEQIKGEREQMERRGRR